MYYPVDWIERGTGKAYKKGYYDELGTYYENVVIRTGKHFETRLMCAFCGTEIKLVWDEGALPSCPNCGAAMREDFGSAVFEDEMCWYAETQGRWNKLDGYNMDGIWHIETNPS